MRERGAFEIEAHVLQTGKLLRRPGGEIAPSAEHRLTSKSKSCPASLERHAYPESWFTGINYLTTLLPQAKGSAIVVAGPLTDESRRQWQLFSAITRLTEDGAGGLGRPYIRARTLAMPLPSPRELWSLPFDVLAHLEPKDDLVNESEVERMSRPTVWIRQSQASADVESDPALFRQQVGITSRQIGELTATASNDDPDATPVFPMGGYSPADILWFLSIGWRDQAATRWPRYAIGLKASPAKDAIRDFGFVFCTP